MTTTDASLLAAAAPGAFANPSEVAAKAPAAANPPRRSSSRRVIVRPTRSASYAPMTSVESIEGVPEASW